MGRDVDYHDQFEGKLFYSPVKNSKMNRLHGDLFYLPVVRKEQSPYIGKVCNIATNDGTYLVSNAIVHNCDFCDANFVCNRIGTGEYVNSWYDKNKVACWKGR